MRNPRKFNKTREWLIELYVVLDRPRKEIANECGLTVAGLKSVLAQLDVKKDKLEIKEEILRSLVDDKKRVEEISELLAVSKTSVYRALKKYDLKIIAEPKLINQYDASNDEQICALYMDGMCTTEIAKIFNMTHTSVKKHLIHCEIPLRTYQEALWTSNHEEDFPKDFYDRNKMNDLYINLKKSKKDLGNLYNCDPGTIDRVLCRLNIEVRNNSEAKIGQMVGDKHPNWKGGISGLHVRLREFFRIQQVPLVLKRDNYKCTRCGSKKLLQVHHIRHFSNILTQLLDENPNLDPVKDLNELYKKAIDMHEFNDLDNLVTYCRECHLFHIHGYKHKSQAHYKSPELLGNLTVQDEDNQQLSLSIEESSTTIPKGSTSKQTEAGDLLINFRSDDMV